MRRKKPTQARMLMSFNIAERNRKWLEKQSNMTQTVNHCIELYRGKVNGSSQEEETILDQILALSNDIRNQQGLVEQEGRKLRYLHYELDELKSKLERVRRNGVHEQAQGVHGVPKEE